MESRLTVDSYGIKKWYNKNGKKHRDNGPAVIWPGGTKLWYRNGQLHREDGPALVRSDSTVEWFLNNKDYSFAEWADKLNLDQKTRLGMVLKWNPN